ncbi:MAG: SDR family NAD(P)-dependent oxidoreductase [Sarcina sp.]
MNKVAIITGGTSGIGKSFAEKLAKRGYDLIITGRRRAIIEEVAMELSEKYKVKVEVKILELTEEEQLKEFIEYIKTKDNIEFLINNAGHGAKDSFTKDLYENQENIMKLHMLLVTKLCHIVANKMKESKKGYIINVSSLAGFNVFPTSAIYCATKGFLISFSESLAMELNKDNIRVQALCPGFARTDFHSKLKMDEKKLKNKGLIRWMSSDEVTEYSLKKIEKPLKVVVIPGFSNRVIYQCLKFIPNKIYYKVASKSWDLL